MDDSERKKIRQQIESDDPKLERVTIKNSHEYRQEYFPPDDDWKKEGEIIGRNTHIRELSLVYIDLEASKFVEFCEGLASNKSITRLKVYHCGAWNGAIWNYLSPFLKQNENLSCLLVNFTAPTGGVSCGIKPLMKALSTFNTLRTFKCCRADEVDDIALGNLIRMLEGHPKLHEIDFGDAILQGKGMAALAGLLENPHRSLRYLRLDLPSFDEEEAELFANALGRNKTLLELDLRENSSYVDNQRLQGIMTEIGRHSSLKGLNLKGYSLDNGVASTLANALASSSKLKCLGITDNQNIREGWMDVFNALRSPLCLLQELHICYNDLDDNLVAYLANSLVDNSVLERLNLQGNGDVSPPGWGSMADVFQSNTALENVDLCDNALDDDVLVLFANSLVHNTKLKTLFLDGDHEEEINEGTWDAFSQCLCDRSSIMATHSSNHTLQRLFDPVRDWVDDDGNTVESESLLLPRLKSLLQINRENARSEAARHKIFMVHFSDFNMQPFLGMKLKVLPQAIAWMAKDDLGRSLLYHYVRSSSVFIDIGGGAKKPGRELPSKRQKMQ